MKLHTGAVCVYHNLIETAVDALKGTDIPVAAVSTGFPGGADLYETKLSEIRESEIGAREIDIVISRAHVLRGQVGKLYEEMVPSAKPA